MTSEYSDQEIILEFINIFASLLIRDKTALLGRVLDSCAEVEDVKVILRDLDNYFHHSENKENNCENELIDSSVTVGSDKGADASFNYDLLEGDNSFEKTEVEMDLENYMAGETKPRISPNIPEKKRTVDRNHCLPNDLQSLIISTNPQQDIHFTLSSRMNTQMLVSGYLLLKRRFYTTCTGLRSVSWKCVVVGCSYHACTVEGKLKDNQLETHNHEKQPELFVKKEARLKLIKNLVEGADASELVQETGEDILGMVGGLENIKQAARRKKRKLLPKVDPLEPKLETKEFALDNKSESDFENFQTKLKEMFNNK